MRTLIIGWTFVFVGLYATAQQPKVVSPTFQPEDPELYFAFFQSHSSLDQQIQASSAAAANQLTNNAIAQYNVTPDDFAKLTVQVRGFQAALNSWQGPVQAYYAKLQASRQLPDMNVVKAFQFQRQSLVKSYYDAVHGLLSPTSWSGLHAYINGAFAKGGKP